MARKSTFGSVDKLPSGRYRARYTGPDGQMYSARTPQDRPLTFQTKGDADAFLAATRTSISKGTWQPPGAAVTAPVTLQVYADAWLAVRPVETRTREHYESLLTNHLVPTFGDQPVVAITPAAVRTWHARPAKPTARAHSYALLRSIMATAVTDGMIPTNPCAIRGAGQAKTAKKVRPATLDELGALVAALPERYRMLAQLACWCSLRFGELAGLKRADVDLKNNVLHVRRGVVRTKAGLVEKKPKSDAGERIVTIPSHIVDDLRDHLRDHAEPGAAGRVFPGRNGGPLAASTLQRVFGPAAEKAGRPDLTPHGLRHTGQTLAALNGANLRELMARAGQSTPAAALRYIAEVDGRQREIADRLAAYATGGSNVTPIKAAKSKRPAKKNVS